MEKYPKIGLKDLKIMFPSFNNQLCSLVWWLVSFRLLCSSRSAQNSQNLITFIALETCCELVLVCVWGKNENDMIPGHPWQWNWGTHESYSHWMCRVVHLELNPLRWLVSRLAIRDLAVKSSICSPSPIVGKVADDIFQYEATVTKSTFLVSIHIWCSRASLLGQLLCASCKQCIRNLRAKDE